jgi:hypothetical protein
VAETGGDVANNDRHAHNLGAGRKDVRDRGCVCLATERQPMATAVAGIRGERMSDERVATLARSPGPDVHTRIGDSGDCADSTRASRGGGR